MLEIKVDEGELFDENSNEFITVKPQILKLEHSLVSISKWESKYHKRFINSEEPTPYEMLDYIRCMTINKVDNNVYFVLSNKNIDDIYAYMNDSMTATTIKEMPGAKRNNEAVTSELIYYWMVAFNIPFECEKWHINRLLTLIKICSIKNQPAKKMSNREIFNQNRALNAARRAKYHSRG